jgi:hypothetical protein
MDKARLAILVASLVFGCTSLRTSLRDAGQSQVEQIREAVVETAAANWIQTTVVCLSFGNEEISDAQLYRLMQTVTVMRQNQCGPKEKRSEDFVDLNLGRIDVRGASATCEYAVETKDGGETATLQLARDDAGWRVVGKQPRASR